MKRVLSIIIIASMVLCGFITGQLFFSDTNMAPDPPELPDLTISSQNIAVSSATSIAGKPVIINATIWNVGSADAN